MYVLQVDTLQLNGKRNGKIGVMYTGYGKRNGKIGVMYTGYAQGQAR